MNKYAIGANDTRPWGTWKVIDAGDGYCVKQIVVQPGGILSLQRHKYRSEHWTIVVGVATVTLDDSIVMLGADEHIYIPATSWHRMENRGTEPLVFIEIQTGGTLDESDIERKEDKYGRI